jgi:hypothetical protein
MKTILKIQAPMEAVKAKTLSRMTIQKRVLVSGTWRNWPDTLKNKELTTKESCTASRRWSSRP